MKKLLIVTGIALLMITASNANAQEFRTDESVASQIKNGTVPGTKISAAPAEKKANTDTEDPGKISVPVKQQLLNGTYPGLTVAKSSHTATPVMKENKKANLPSDTKPAAIEEKKQQVVNIPTQEVKTEKENN